MVWRNLLLISIVGLAISGISAATTGGCSPWQQQNGSCGSAAAVADGQVTTWAFDGAKGTQSTTATGTGRTGAGRSGGSSAPPTDPRGAPSWCTGAYCGWEADSPPSASEGQPGFTLEDVAAFAPTVPPGSMEPGPGIAVRRLPANFISHATEQIEAAPLLGDTVAVRFTPAGFAWDTCDGGRIESTSPGRTWSELRVKELTDTVTSHRYRERGYVEVRPTVTYDAAYRYAGSDWIPVGSLDVAGDPFRVRVVTVETRLTRGDCLRYPNDPGCK